QYRGASSGCGGWISASRKEINCGRSAPGQPPPLRLLLLGFICTGVAVVRAESGEQKNQASYAARNRAGRKRNCCTSGGDLNCRTAATSGDDGSAGHRVRLFTARERNSSSAFLGCSVHQTQSCRCPRFRR